MKRVPASGPLDAQLYIIGEAPGKEEEEYGKPFIGQSGMLLSRMLASVGQDRNQCRINNVVQYRPPGNRLEAWWPDNQGPNETVRNGIRELLADLQVVRPRVALLLGRAPLRALFGYDSIIKWRGSHLVYQDGDLEIKCIPTYHPAYLLRQPQEQYVTSLDIGRACARASGRVPWPNPQYEFILRPSAEKVIETLSFLQKKADEGPLILSVDIETRNKQIACIGISWSPTQAICIPILCVERWDGYFSPEEELEVVFFIRQLLTHENVSVVGQNFPYDSQYLIRQWGLWCKLNLDTMTAHHSLFSLLPKGLDFLSSFYLEDHIYWKDEGKDWNPKYMNEEQLWRYNCIDAVRTYAIAEEIKKTLLSMNYKRTKYGTPCEMQHNFQDTVLKMMLRGIRVDEGIKKDLGEKLLKAEQERIAWLQFITSGTEKMANSPKQLCQLFYEDLGIKPVMNYRVSPPRPTTNDDALEKIKKQDPLAVPLCETISEIRTMKIFHAVCAQPVDHDGRMRCSYIIPGTSTYRLASREDAFGFGTNLQNVSTGADYKNFSYPMPNLRKMFIADEGKTIGDFDGAQADARVVAWEANDELLKAIFRDKSRDLHTENAKDIFGACSGKGDPRRQLAKTGVHAANYIVTPSVLASHLGITTHEAEQFLARWFSAHPAIAEWHRRIRLEISSRRYVENAYGYRCYFFGRVDDIIKEAVAWIPQSTVGITINQGIRNVDLALPHVEALLQTHDSGTFQFPLEGKEETSKQICQLMEIEIPYEDPLVIPIDAHLGHSWGDCK
ncbi:MAG: hypothetical protein DA330_00845 [Nitrososphaera sp.]|nr:hypothetical protein [Nitrososphaera sp.]